jgi:hypothetical protein
MDGHYHLQRACATGPPSLRSRQIAFANEQPLLLISEAFVDAANDVRLARTENLCRLALLTSKYGWNTLVGQAKDQSALGRWLEPRC